MKRRSVWVLVLFLCLAVGIQAYADDRAVREIGLILDGFERGYLEEDLDLIHMFMPHQKGEA